MTTPKDQSKRDLNLYQKLAAITGDLEPIAKGGTNRDQNYNFIEYAAVAGALRKLFAEYGIIIVPYMHHYSKHERKEFTTGNGKRGISVLVPFAFVVFNADKPEEKISVTWTGEATDYGDKAVNKAATAALKYYLMRQFNISEKGDEDPDVQTPDRPPATAKTTSSAKAENAPMTGMQRAKLFATLAGKGVNGEHERKHLIHKYGKVESTTDLTKDGAATLIDLFENTEKDLLQKQVAGIERQGTLKEVGEAVRKLIPKATQDQVLSIVLNMSSQEDIKTVDLEAAKKVLADVKGIKDASILETFFVTDEEPAADAAAADDKPEEEPNA